MSGVIFKGLSWILVLVFLWVAVLLTDGSLFLSVMIFIAIVFGCILMCPLTWVIIRQSSDMKLSPLKLFVFGALLAVGCITLQVKYNTARANDAGFSSPADQKFAQAHSLTPEQFYANAKKGEALGSLGASDTCRQSLDCWSDRNDVGAYAACKSAISNTARFSARWTAVSIFSKKRWADQGRGVIEYSGNDLELQNGLGIYIRHHYTCLYDPSSGSASVSVAPGAY